MCVASLSLCNHSKRLTHQPPSHPFPTFICPALPVPPAAAGGRRVQVAEALEEEEAKLLKAEEQVLLQAHTKNCVFFLLLLATQILKKVLDIVTFT